MAIANYKFIYELIKHRSKKKCKKCEHEWIARVLKPIRCPKCLAYDWDKKTE